jgi:hypothetical protein
MKNNNINIKNKIKEYLSSCEDNEADFHSIWLYLNENARHGVIHGSLSNILGKHKYFLKVGKETIRNPTTRIWTVTTIWRLVE